MNGKNSIFNKNKHNDKPMGKPIHEKIKPIILNNNSEQTELAELEKLREFKENIEKASKAEAEEYLTAKYKKEEKTISNLESKQAESMNKFEEIMSKIKSILFIKKDIDEVLLNLKTKQEYLFNNKGLL